MPGRTLPDLALPTDASWPAFLKFTRDLSDKLKLKPKIIQIPTASGIKYNLTHFREKSKTRLLEILISHAGFSITINQRPMKGPGGYEIELYSNYFGIYDPSPRIKLLLGCNSWTNKHSEEAILDKLKNEEIFSTFKKLDSTVFSFIYINKRQLMAKGSWNNLPSALILDQISLCCTISDLMK